MEAAESTVSALMQLGPTLGGVLIFCLAVWGIVIALARLKGSSGGANTTMAQETFNKIMLERLNTVESVNSELRERVSRLEIENAKLRQDLALMESAHQDLPLPMWLKDANGICLAVNKSYEDVFLRTRGFTRLDYIGELDESVWPEEVATSFRQHDSEVFVSGKTFNGVEKIPDHDDRLIEWHIIKYVRYAAGVKIGIAGIAIPQKENVHQMLEEQE